MSASDKVFALPELLEMTLLHLPLHDLLLSQQVSKDWQAAVQGSANIRRALFFDRTPDTTIREGVVKVYKDGVRQPEKKFVWQTEEGNPLPFPPIFNPFLNRFRTVGNQYGEGYLALVHYGFINPTDLEQPHIKLEERRASWYYKEASWKKMLTMSPAADEMFMMCLCLEDSEEDVEFDDAEGVRFGPVVQGIQEHWLSCPNCPAWVDEHPCTGGFRWSFSGGDEMILGSADVGSTGSEMLAVLEKYSDLR